MQFVHSPYLGYTTSNNGSQQSSTSQQTNPQGLPYAPLDQQLNYHQQPTPGVQHHQQQQQQQPHPGYPGGYVPQQMLSQNDSSSTGGGPVKPKRKQVKNACVNCQKACKKCDDARPCPRCIKYGIEATCVNSVRKERKKGVKRGPYKQRKGQDADNASATSQPSTPVPETLSSLTSPNGNPMLHPYLRALGAGDSYQPHQPTHVMSPYTVPPAIMQQMYQAEYQPTTAAVKQQQSPQQQHQQQQQEDSNNTGVKAKETSSAGTDSDEEGNKLNILSQLCSAVLDHSDSPKEDADQNDSSTNTPATATTPTPTNKKDQYTLLSGQTGYNIPTNAQQQQSSGGARNFVYPSSNGNNTANSSPTQQMHPYYQQQQSQQVWPLPPLQSVVPSDRNMYYQQQNPLQHTPQNQENGNDNWNGSTTPQWQ
ncbi:hypothetical protein INT45_013332 [Circinella minor]|uniref:Zn(2)-C6 fungal-type domain-containing protein n=1 Tax=Circinella minor TaxID=1195481 RepID=A0A8H7RWE4_9FUNG|nr:hypothetical protein INT45_013332 [Circinella minor]